MEPAFIIIVGALNLCCVILFIVFLYKVNEYKFGLLILFFIIALKGFGLIQYDTIFKDSIIKIYTFYICECIQAILIYVLWYYIHVLKGITYARVWNIENTNPEMISQHNLIY